MNEKKMLVPKLRFPEFTDAWEQRKLGEIVEIIGGGTPDTSIAEYWDGDIDWYSPTEIGNQIYVKNSARKITLLGLQRSSAKILPAKKTILFTSRASIGDMAILEKSGSTNQGFQSLVIKDENINVYFLFSLGHKIKTFALKHSTGSTFLEISKNALGKMELAIPQIKEQQKIGSLFAQIDQYITSHQRKLENLKKLKTGLLQKMFPKDNQKFPELRFPEFTDAWEQRKFKDLVNIRRGLTYKPSDIVENGIRVLRSSNIDEDVFVLKNDDIFVKPSAVNIPLVQKDEILITSANGSSRLVGKHALVTVETASVHGGFMLIAKAKNPNFVNSLMNSLWYLNFIHTYVAGGNGAIGNLNKKDLEDQDVVIPFEHEQQKIGSFFAQIDQYITSHQRKLENLKLLKKSLLQQMFV